MSIKPNQLVPFHQIANQLVVYRKPPNELMKQERSTESPIKDVDESALLFIQKIADQKIPEIPRILEKDIKVAVYRSSSSIRNAKLLERFNNMRKIWDVIFPVYNYAAPSYFLASLPYREKIKTKALSAQEKKALQWFNNLGQITVCVDCGRLSPKQLISVNQLLRSLCIELAPAKSRISSQNVKLINLSGDDSVSSAVNPSFSEYNLLNVYLRPTTVILKSVENGEIKQEQQLGETIVDNETLFIVLSTAFIAGAFITLANAWKAEDEDSLSIRIIKALPTIRFN